MAFMQKAMNKQRERAKEEASVLLRELEDASAAAAEQDSEDDTRMDPSNKGKKGKARGGASWAAGEEEEEEANSSTKRSSDGRDGNRASREARAAAAAEVAKTLPAGALQSAAVSMDSRVRSSVASPITVDLGGLGGGAGGSSMGVDGSQAEGSVQSLNRASDGAKAEDMAAESAVSKRRRETTGEEGNGGVGVPSRRGASGGAGGTSEDRDGDGEGEGEGDEGDNPWLAPTPRRSKQRRRNNNGNSGEVLLDVRKAAATALSAFSGTSDGGKEAAATANGLGNNGEEARDAAARGENGATASQGSENGAGKEKYQKGGDGRGGAGRGKRKKGTGNGKGASGDGEGQGEAGDPTSRKQATASAGGRGKANNKITATQQANGNHDAAGTTQKDAAGGRGGGGGPRALAGLSNDELVRRAFAAPDFETEFKDSKDGEVESAISKGREKMPKDLAGWGAWAGDGAPVPRGPTKRQVVAKKAQVTRPFLLGGIFVTL